MDRTDRTLRAIMWSAIGFAVAMFLVAWETWRR